ncbi:MAG TPA: glycosyltransferase family 4 protein [Pyrinomonadaceae bacterium]|jgi:glycosyltransferase involved in cell wall biosynthesis
MSKQKGKKILFITPAAKRDGANIFLLRFLRWLKAETAIEFCTIYNAGGDLENEFRELSETHQYSLGWQPGNFFERRAYGLLRRLEVKKRWLLHQIRRRDIGLIYNNTVVNHQIIEAFQHLNVPILTHCHELESVIRRTGLERFRETKNKTAHFIAVSETTRRFLMTDHDVPGEKISLVRGFVPIENFSKNEVARTRRRILKQLGIPSDAFVVGASGAIEWRKAPDLYVQIAARIRKSHPELPIYFLWIGGTRRDDLGFFETDYDIRKLGLADRLRILEHQPNPRDYYAALDAFAMVSREDPFPLVCLEAAALGKPIVCFENGGGIPEFVGADCGFVVPYLDTEAFAEKIVALFRSRNLTETFGRNAARKVRERHNIERSAPRILDLIKEWGNL